MATKKKVCSPEQSEDQSGGSESDSGSESEGSESGEEEGSGGSSSASEISLTLDEDGRVPGGILPDDPKPPNLNYSFKSFLSKTKPDEEQLTRLTADCEKAFTARTVSKSSKSSYSAGSTFFIPSDSEPRNALERLALSIFRFHTSALTPGKDFSVASSGAEWWSLVLNPGDDVSFHWDRDYALEDDGVNVHPHLATVTYLSSSGAPTIIAEKVSPMERGDNQAESLPGPVSKIHLSRPEVGKHTSFDGRWLHGAPSDSDVWHSQATAHAQARTLPTGPGRRVTFLVNIWLNHTPYGSEPYPKESASSHDDFEPSWLSWGEATPPPQVFSDLDSAGSSRRSWRFRDGGRHMLSSKFPESLLQESLGTNITLSGVSDIEEAPATASRKKQRR